MPINEYFKGHGSEVMDSMQKRYGGSKGKSVFYATAQKRGLKPMAYGGISVPDDPYAGYDTSYSGAGDEDWRRRMALQQAPGPQMPAPIPAPPPPPSNVPEPPPRTATPPPPPEVNNDPGEPVPDEPSATLSNGPGSPLADQNTPHSTPTVDAAQPPDDPGSASPASPSPVSSPSTEEGPGPIEPPQQEKPLATSNAFGMGPMRNTGERTKAAIEYGDKILKDPKTGDFKKPSTLQNILGAVLQVSPRTRGIDVHPNLTRQYQNYGMLANQAEEERKSQVAMAQEESHRATGIAAMARATRDMTKPGKLTKTEEWRDRLKAGEEEAARLGYKKGSPEWDKVVLGYSQPASVQLGNLAGEDATRRAAERLLFFGEAPQGGKGGTAFILNVHHVAAEIAKEKGINVGQAELWRTQQKADSADLTKLQQQRDQMMSFESTASKNLDIALQGSKGNSRTGIPLVNHYLQWIQGRIMGDDDVALFNNAIETAANEYAKVTTGVTSGVLSDAARAQAKTMLDKSLSDGTFTKVVAQMKQEMQNRRTGYDEQLKEIRSRIAGRTEETPLAMPAAPAAPPPPAAPKLPLVGSRQGQAEPPPVAPSVAVPPPAPVPQVAPGVKSPGPATPGPVNVTVGGVTYPFPNQKTADEALAKYRAAGGR